MARRRPGVAIGIGIVLAFLLGVGTVLPGGNASVLGAEPLATLLITTPTPTWLPYLIPTATPTPVPTPQPEAEVGFYVVKPGDTLLTVALEVGMDLSEVFCLLAPDYAHSEPLVIGTPLPLSSLEYVCHEIQAGESLPTIAAQYGTTPQAIVAVEWNALSEEDSVQNPLVAGHHLRVPGKGSRYPELPVAQGDGFLPLMLSQPAGSSPHLVRVVSEAMVGTQLPAVGGAGALYHAPVPADWPYGSGDFAWPLFGWLSQGFHAEHPAIDVAAPVGTLVTAADRGVVLRTGWNGQGYGLFVAIDHNIDYITLYSHLSEVLVEEGQVVAQGQAVGRVGSTGNSTGPHLHFEIRDFGQRIDPIPILLRRR